MVVAKAGQASCAGLSHLNTKIGKVTRQTGLYKDKLVAKGSTGCWRGRMSIDGLTEKMAAVCVEMNGKSLSGCILGQLLHRDCVYISEALDMVVCGGRMTTTAKAPRKGGSGPIERS